MDIENESFIIDSIESKGYEEIGGGTTKNCFQFENINWIF
ncbi:hypothetical protein DDB_G0271584 [Dictyostelium discoideum AX4]|uniref:Uncharacterized protein n=1 Tax=Dictyostelium discoideum TaxID=44689 RepID=Q55AU4_DICDI|nr:hypothetical protein DDB_G0271584 [Dictyostelium discoideum AX4]EAL71656.1 hypothetical protein DDB_G0271584 [Dictyostelium discoideum AX4]|eukprot:XP_645602.1 hypothetical protein DDB_G0271584 [Dictyostelium discoideum AX4]